MAATATPTLPISGATDQRWIVRLLPSLTDFAILIPVILLVWLFPDGLNTLLGDGDTGWHIRTGEWILQHGAVPHQDPFSFTRPGQTWFAWEWGWDVLFAVVHSYAGLAGVVFVNLLVLCTVAALLFRAVRGACDNDLFALILTTLGLGASVVHWLARPHLLSWLFFLVLLAALREAESGNRRHLWWLPALVLIWTNIHGSFFVAVFMILLSAIGQALAAGSGSAFSWQQAWMRSRDFWLCAVLCGVATFANPYTWHVHAHIFQYLGDAGLMDNNQEFQSPGFHHGPTVLFGWLVLPGAAAALWCFQKRNWSACLALLVWAHLSLVAARNIPFFVFVACPLIAAMAQDVFGSRLRAVFPAYGLWVRRLQEELLPFEKVERCHLTSILVLCFVAFSLRTGQPGYAAGFPARRFPVAALPAIEKAHAKRVFASDQWGDFLLYKLYPSTRVFIDGRSDFYGAADVERCQHISNARWDWEDGLNQFLVDMVVVTPDTPIATVLKHSGHWSVLFDNGSVIVFGLRPRSSQTRFLKKDSQFSAAPHTDGGNRLEADLAFKYRTPKYERRCI